MAVSNQVLLCRPYLFAAIGCALVGIPFFIAKAATFRYRGDWWWLVVMMAFSLGKTLALSLQFLQLSRPPLPYPIQPDCLPPTIASFLQKVQLLATCINAFVSASEALGTDPFPLPPPPDLYNAAETSAEV